MIAVWRLTVRALSRGLPGLLALLLGVALFEVVQAPVVDAIGGPQGLDAMLARIPPALQAFTRTRPEFMAMSGLPGYLSLGFTHPLYLVLCVAAIVGFAARSLAGEMERGTVQLALSRPISRSQFYSSRLVGVVAISMVLAIVGPLGLIAGFVLAQPVGPFAMSHLIPMAIGSLALFFAIAGLALFGAAAASSAGRVLGLGLALFVLMYFIDYFAGIWTFIKPIEFLSLFDYYDPTSSLVLGTVEPTNLAVLGIVGIVGIAAGLVVFIRRDLPT